MINRGNARQGKVDLEFDKHLIRSSLLSIALNVDLTYQTLDRLAHRILRDNFQPNRHNPTTGATSIA